MAGFEKPKQQIPRGAFRTALCVPNQDQFDRVLGPRGPGTFGVAFNSSGWCFDLSTPIRKYGDAFFVHCQGRQALCALSLAMSTRRSRRVKVHLNGFAAR